MSSMHIYEIHMSYIMMEEFFLSPKRGSKTQNKYSKILEMIEIWNSKGLKLGVK